MIPLRDNNPSRSFPLMTILIIAANVYVYYWQYSIGQQMNDVAVGCFGFVPYELTHTVDLVGTMRETASGNLHFVPGLPAHVLAMRHVLIVLGPSPHPLWLTIFSAMFMHASFMHIAGNMLFLWVFGNKVEEALGVTRYLLFYLLCGFAAACTQTAAAPNSMIPNIGASGAVAGIMGAYLVMWPGARILTLISLGFLWFLREVSAFWVLGVWIIIQVMTVQFQQGGETGGGVAYWAHIGGFFVGMVGILLLGGTRVAQRRRRRMLDDYDDET